MNTWTDAIVPVGASWFGNLRYGMTPGSWIHVGMIYCLLPTVSLAIYHHALTLFCRYLQLVFCQLLTKCQIRISLLHINRYFDTTTYWFLYRNVQLDLSNSLKFRRNRRVNSSKCVTVMHGVTTLTASLSHIGRYCLSDCDPGHRPNQ